MNIITCKSDPLDLRIYINDIIHFYIDKSKLVSIQSWYETKTSFKIEISTTSGDVRLEYNNKEKWKTILKLIDENI